MSESELASRSGTAWLRTGWRRQRMRRLGLALGVHIAKDRVEDAMAKLREELLNAPNSNLNPNSRRWQNGGRSFLTRRRRNIP